MGKGLIISGGTKGQYLVESIFEKERCLSEIARLTIKIADLTSQIAAVVDVSEKEILAKKILEVSKLSCEKRKTYLENNAPNNERLVAWCTDLTENLIGDVGLIEILGESISFNIQPGYSGNSIYNKSRDGQLVPTIAQTPAQAFYNLAMLPGWQKWKPTFRYATISNLSGDTCTVMFEQTKSTQQSLDVNQSSTMDDVNIEYMSCNGSVFENGDSVVVAFTGQDWSVPKVIGFKDNPKPCAGDIIIIISSKSGNEAFAWDVLSDMLIVPKNTMQNVISQLSIKGHDGHVQLLPSGHIETFETIPDPTVYPHRWVWQPPLEIPEAFRSDIYYDYPDIEEGFYPYPYSNDFKYKMHEPYDNEMDITTRFPYISNPDDPEDLKAAHMLIWWIPRHPGSIWFEYILAHYIFAPELSEQEIDLSGRYPNRVVEFYGLVKDASWDTSVIVPGSVPPVAYDPDYKAFLSSGMAVNETKAAVFDYTAICDGWDFEDDTGFTGDYESKTHMFVKQDDILKGLALEIAKLINNHREDMGLKPLKANINLTKAAERHAPDIAAAMISGPGTGHIGTDGSTPETRITDAGYYLNIDSFTPSTIVAENVAWNYNANDALQAWLMSPGHRANIEHERFNEMGIGVAKRTDGIFVWVQTFGAIKGRWPGFGPVGPGMETYLKDNFNFDGSGDETRVPLFYLV